MLVGLKKLEINPVGFLGTVIGKIQKWFGKIGIVIRIKFFFFSENRTAWNSQNSKKGFINYREVKKITGAVVIYNMVVF